MDKPTTPISKEDFETLRLGDGIKDRYGRIWTVVRTDKGHLADVRHWMTCYDYDPAIGLIWLNKQIMEEEEYAIQLDLTHPSAEVKQIH